MASVSLPDPTALDNVQANDDCDPKAPQNETAVAFNVNDPMNAVAAANDYCGDGFWIGYTSDGGETWDSDDISTQAWNPDQSFFTCGCFIGDSNAIAASDDVAYPVWTDGRNTPGRPSGDTDIFTNVEKSS